MERQPKRIILDIDVTDDPTHGNQEGTAFNGYYQHECYTPSLIVYSRHLLSAKLRPANVDPATGALGELQCIFAHLRGYWPQVKIVVRGDSDYMRISVRRILVAFSSVAPIQAIFQTAYQHLQRLLQSG